MKSLLAASAILFSEPAVSQEALTPVPLSTPVQDAPAPARLPQLERDKIAAELRAWLIGPKHSNETDVLCPINAISEEEKMVMDAKCASLSANERQKELKCAMPPFAESQTYTCYQSPEGVKRECTVLHTSNDSKECHASLELGNGQYFAFSTYEPGNTGDAIHASLNLLGLLNRSPYKNSPYYCTNKLDGEGVMGDSECSWFYRAALTAFQEKIK